MLDPEIWIYASNWFFFFFINITFSVFCLCRFYFILCLPIQANANSTHFCFCQISLQQWIQFHIIPILIVFRTVELQTLLSGTSQCSCPRRQIFWEQKRRELFILVSLFATQTSRLLSNDCVLTDRVISSQPPDESSCNFKRRYALLMIMYIITSCKFIFLLLATSAMSSFCNDMLLALAFFNALNRFNFVTQIEVVVSLPLLRCSTAIIWLMRWSTSTMVVHYYEKTLSCYDSTGMTLALAWWQLTCWHSG